MTKGSRNASVVMMQLEALFCTLLFCSIIGIAQSQSAIGRIVENATSFGSNVTLTCTGTAAAGDMGIIRWIRLSPLSVLAEKIGVTTEETLVHILTNVNASDGGDYICSFDSILAADINDTKTLQILPYFTVHPQNIELQQLQILRLACEAEAFPSPSIQWEKMNRETEMFEAIVGETSTVFMINFVTFNDFGMYRCVATNVINGVEYNATSSAALVTISPEGSVMIQQQNMTFDYEDKVNLICTTQGGPNNMFTWSFNGSSIIYGTNSYIFISTEFFSILMINNITAPDHGGLYQCIAQNSAGSGIDTTYVFISPRFLIHPVQTLAVNGTIQNLTCEAESFPVPQYMWYKHEQDEGTLDVGPDDYLLPFNPIVFGDAGIYQCKATSNSITIYSNNATLYVSPEGSVQLINQTLTKQGGTFSLECIAEGGPNNQHVWYHRGVLFVDTSVLTIIFSSDTRSFSVLRVPNVDAAMHKGDYTCVVTNMAGSESKTSTVVVSPEGIVSISPINATHNRGDNVTFICTTDAGPNNIYVWLRNTSGMVCLNCDGGSFNKSIDRNFFIEPPRALTQVIVLNNITAPTDGGKYYCVVQNEAGYDIVSSTLFVVPEFIVQPQNMELQQLQTLRLTCEAEAFPSPSIQWEKMNRETEIFEAIVGETSTVFMINSVTFNDFGMYRCVATNVINGVEYNATSSAALVTISPEGSVMIQQQNMTFDYEDKVNLICTTQGGPNNMFTWSFNGSSITYGTNSYIFISTEFFSILMINNITAPDHGGLYQCIAQNSAGSGNDTTYVFISPRFLIHPVQTLAVNGTIQNLTCEAESFPVPQYMWYKHEQDEGTLDVGPDDYLLPFNPIVFGDAGIYQCKATSNSITIYSNNATLYVSPEGSVQLINQTLTKQGGTFSLECIAEGGPNNQHVWYHRGVLVVDTSVLTIIFSSDTRSVSVLRVPNVDAAMHKGDYTCVVTNMAGSESKTSTVVVSPEGIVSISPINATHNRGDNVTFICTTDAGPNNIYVWLRNTSGMVCLNCDGGSFNKSIDRNFFIGPPRALTQVIVLNNITAPTNGGKYYCVVQNEAGYDIVSSTLFVVPEFIVQPQNMELQQLQTLRLTCEAEAFPSPSIQWEKMNRVTGMFEAIVGENRNVFMINSVNFSDFGMYHCVATNVINGVEYNTTSSAALVTISPEGSVMIQPQNMTFNYEDEVNLICTSQARPNNMFTWLVNGSAIKSGINSYTIISTEFFSVLMINHITAPDHGGLYQCIAQNSAGNGSNTTYVYISPRFLKHPVQILAVNGMINNLTCEAESFPVPQYIWHKHEKNGGTSDVGQNDHLLPFNPIGFSDAGVYQCTATSNSIIIYSNNATLSVSPEGSVQLINQTLTKQGGTFSLECRAEGGPNNQHVWYHRGVAVVATSVLTIISFNSDTRSVSILSVSNVDVATHKGDYTCNVTNMAGSESKTSIVVVPPSVLPVSNYIIGLFNESITIAFTISDVVSPVNLMKILWQVKPLNSDTFRSIFPTSPDRLSLTIPNAQLSDRGMYKMSAENEAGDDEAIVTVNVFVKAALQNDTGGSVTKERGQSVKFNCTADGVPRPDIVWRRNGQLLLNASRVKIMTSEQSNGFRSNIIPGVLQRTSMLEITSLGGSDNGSYSCRADNEANNGVVLMIPFTLQVVEPPPTNHCLTIPCGKHGKCNSLSNGYLCKCFTGYSGINCENVVSVIVPPQITRSPQDTSGTIYSTVNLTCKATGSPLPTILWYKDNVLIPNDNTDVSVLLFPELDLNDRGFYHCEAGSIINGNSMSVISSRALLNITDIIQYEGVMQLPDDFYDTTKRQTIPGKLSDFIREINNYISGSSLNNVSNTSFFSIQILNQDNINYTTQIFTIPIVITMITQQEPSEQLKIGVQQQIGTLGAQLSKNISIVEVDRFDGCQSTKTVIPSPSGRQDLSITILWPETNIGVLTVLNCPCGKTLQATRYCGGDFTNGAKWSEPNVAACNFSDLAREICQLRNLPVTEKVEKLENRTSDHTVLGSTEVETSVSVLVTAVEEVAENITLSTVFLEVVDNILDVREDILQESQETSNTSSTILEAVGSVSENIPITNTSLPVVIALTSFAVSAQQICNEIFNQSSVTFSVKYENFSNGLDNNNVIFGASDQQPTAAISLPNNLLSTVPTNSNCTKITNAVFITDSLFLRRSRNFLEVSSLIIAASVVGRNNLKELDPPVDLRFLVNSNMNGSFPRCSFWNQSLDNGYGDWSSEGCRNTTVNDTEVICECNHLTNFAILLDVSSTIEPTERTGLTLFLDSVTYIGIIVSLVCLTVTVISYLSNKNLRTSDHGQLLLNLCFALMGLYITFIISVHSKGVPGVCAVVGAVLQYFFLVTFMVMAAEAINLYMNLVIVLGSKIRHFVLKATILSWVTPLFIVLFCFAPNYKNYLSDHFCRAFTVPYYIGMVVPFLIIYFFNWVVFFIIIVSLRKKQSTTKSRNKVCTFLHQQLIGAIVLSILFGLGWGIGLFVTQDIHTNKTVQDGLAALFVVFTAFHGLFIFIMHCLRSKEVRTTWKRLCFVVTRKDISELTSSTFLRIHQKVLRYSSNPEFAGGTKFAAKNSCVFVNDDATMKRHSGFEGSEMSIHEINDPSDTLRSKVLKSITEAEEGIVFAETPFTKANIDEIEEESKKI